MDTTPTGGAPEAVATKAEKQAAIDDPARIAMKAAGTTLLAEADRLVRLAEKHRSSVYFKFVLPFTVPQTIAERDAGRAYPGTTN